MATVDEAATSKTPLGSDLEAGVNSLALDQEVTFTLYQRLVLPLDGYVFWVRADTLSLSSLLNAAAFNTTFMNKPFRVAAPAPVLTVMGSLHYATERRQEEDENYSINRVVFTSLSEVVDLNDLGPNSIFIAAVGGRRYAFSSRGSFYRQADLYHYTGEAVYPDMDTQVVEDARNLDTREVVVSNSLPIWLSLNNYVPSRPAYGFACPTILYPSFLSPPNLEPPFGTVHIDGTQALAATPHLGRTSSHSQLVQERVRVTLWGTRNFNAMDFLDCVYQFSRDYDRIGIMNSPVVRDEKRTQRELGVIAQKKVIEFEVNYHQAAARDIARQMVKSCIPTFTPR